MTLSADLTLVEDALDGLEQRETRVLVWGLVDSALGDQEVHDVLNAVFEGEKYQEVAGQSDCSLHTAEELLRRLQDLGLLFEVPTRLLGTPRRWRTRMAEGLRLLTRLRQLMPRHKGATAWATAPTLVADYRLLWRRRRYPHRNLGIDQAAQALEACLHSDETLQAVRHWLGKAPPGWKLSRFQLDAATRILGALDQQRVSATLVSAGTGSGKTLAFYLPALSWLAAQKISQPHPDGVRILAIYPRNELLKDQLSEVYDQARKFDDLLGKGGGRPISVGVLYGDTPRKLTSIKYAWKEHQGDCPFFKCPVPSCGSAMKVTSEDLNNKNERLTCVKCGHHVDRATLHLTRQSMQEQPPDILFTSVEMLNQRMSDSDMRHLFGLGPNASRVPSLVLLDEVHVYSGTYGAQVAHLLRRWSRLSGRRSSFVGLSATLSEGEHFFASLVGLNENIVKEIMPRPEDMDSEGAEYMVALRGDPVSQSALLSTSIQTLMLGTRLLDTRGKFDPVSRPFAGWRAFAFTDQMDATNRLFADLRDAEGWLPWGKPDMRRPNGGLAHLRLPDVSNPGRYEAGQDWRLPVKIGHDLGRRHKIDRTTSYQPGVADDTEVVVATAALEVGYDDEAVGLVLQHKAPRDMAQFLQRKGRAGRTRHMRPWTIMVLSDYGRDRLAYQAYEQFFDPELPPRELPMSNRYVQRMQAVYALMDYLGLKMQVGWPTGSVWQDLSGPPNVPAEVSTQMRRELMELAKSQQFPLTMPQFRQLHQHVWRIVSSLQSPLVTDAARRGVAFHLRRRHLVQLLISLLTRSDDAENLAQHLMTALDLPRQAVDALLWEHPRPVLLEVAPTALRRLERNWEAHGEAQSDYRTGNPLPEFVPGALFSDLSLPEVRIDRPQPGREVYLPVQQALGELAPGKVSKRFDQSLWLGVGEDMLMKAVLDSSTEFVLDAQVDSWYDLEPHHAFHIQMGSQVEQLPAFRPRVVKLQPTPNGASPNFPLVKPTSNARLVWNTQIFARRVGHHLALPHGKVGIAALFAGVKAHTHGSQSPASVRRYAVGSLASLRLGGVLAAAAGTGESTVDQRIHFRFTHRTRACGVGYEIDVDALRFELDLPPCPHQSIDFDHAPTLRGLRTARYFWEARYGHHFEALEPNGFLRHWMAEIFLTAVMQRCTHENNDLRNALDWIAASPQNLMLEPILESLFQAPAPFDDEVGDDDDNEGQGQGVNGQARDPDRLRAKLREGLVRPEVIAALRSIGEHLVEQVDASWDGWLTQTMKHTLAAALLDAIQSRCPQVDADDLAVDVDAGPSEVGEIEPGHRIWITEVNPGGNGLVEQVIEALATDAAGFYRQIEIALGMSEFEVIDEQLRGLIGRIGRDDPDLELLGRVQAVRHSETTQQAEEAIAALRRQLVLSGHSVFHGYVAAMANRVLRPGTPDELDRILAQLLTTWADLEHRLGVEVDSRVICAIFSRDARIDAAFAGAGLELPPTSQRHVWRFTMLMGVIWARGHALRANSLPLPLRYELVPAVTERLILRRWLTVPEDPIRVNGTDWLTQVHARLMARGRTSVTLPHNRNLLSQVVQALTTQPVQMEYLNVYPRLLSVARTVDAIELRLELVETL
jgi:hypothetical protein